MSETTASVSRETLKRLRLYKDLTSHDSLDAVISDGLDALGAPSTEELETLLDNDGDGEAAESR